MLGIGGGECLLRGQLLNRLDGGIDLKIGRLRFVTGVDDKDIRRILPTSHTHGQVWSVA